MRDYVQFRGIIVKKTFSLLLLLLFMILSQPGVLQAALSLEALDMVEQLRRGLEKHPVSETPVQTADSGEYIPGKALESALRKMRQRVYGEKVVKLPTRTESLEKVVEEVNVPELYVPGVALRTAIERVKASRDPDEMCNEMVNVPDPSQAPAKPQMVEAPKPQNQAISEPNPEKEALKLKSANETVKPSVEENIDTSKEKDQETQQLNQQLEKHEFKMPGNYRVIVR